ncbi:MAG: helix-turn-helix domain-containing protein, partial [Pyrinomonadaceae bacterium]
AASPDLAHIVLSYWEFTVPPGDANEPRDHEVFPDGCVSLVYYRNERNADSWLGVSGARLDSLQVKVFAGDVFWGARLSAPACRPVLNRDSSALQNQTLPLSEFLPETANELLQNMGASNSFAEAIKAYESSLRVLQVKREDVDGEVAVACELIETSKGQAKIAETAAAVGLSVRQLERRFRRVTGFTPKQFARLRRLRATAVTLADDREMGWATRAVEMGFADQAHLTREFVRLTGRSPVAFAENVAKIEHGDLIK